MARKITSFGLVLQPSEANEPILSRPVRASLIEWLEELWLEDELKAAELKPRKRAMFSGDPGTGKTTLAHHLAARIRLPMLAVRSDRIISKWVGANTENMGDLFDAIANEPKPLLLFLDEFDSIAATRSTVTGGAGEKDNIDMVNALLQRLDQYDGFVIAATNHAANIDPAVWRRFEIHIELGLPGQEERERIIARYLRPFGMPAEALTDLAYAFETATPALIRQFIEGMKRQIVVGPRVGWNMQKEAVVDRLTTSFQPHAKAAKPRLWQHGAKDQSVRGMPWPLPFAKDLPAIAREPELPISEKVVRLGGSR